jgi:hypothetical protein
VARSAKRYVLLVATGDLSEDEARDLKLALEGRFEGLKFIRLKGDSRSVIVKTTNAVAPALREEASEVVLGGRRIVPVLTSGSIGKLKRRASEMRSSADGEVHER